jgi:hypothetical protein
LLRSSVVGEISGSNKGVTLSSDCMSSLDSELDEEDDLP